MASAAANTEGWIIVMGLEKKGGRLLVLFEEGAQTRGALSPGLRFVKELRDGGRRVGWVTAGWDRGEQKGNGGW